MILGHFAVGFASKRLAPRTSLGTLMVAPILLDLLWPIFLLLGIEHVRIVPGITAFTPLDFVSYPWSHSLLMSIVWGVLFAAFYRARGGYARGAVVVAAGVVSHWVCDWIVHRPDLPLVPWGGPKFGLGLWNSPAATVALECAMLLVGLWLYLRTTRARNWRGHVSLWGFVAIMSAIYVANMNSAPPPSERAIAWVGLSMWIFIPWIYWIDRERELRAGVA